MNVGRHVKLFKSGRSQSVRIPRKSELPRENAIIRKEGASYHRACSPLSLLARLKTLQPIEDDLVTIDDIAAEAVAF
jgi:antitoxin VapB